MFTALLILQFFIILGLVAAVLLQKTGADSMSGLSTYSSGVLSGKAASHLLTKSTIIFAVAFMANSLLLAKVVTNQARHTTEMLNIEDTVIGNQQQESAKRQLEAPLAK